MKKILKTLAAVLCCATVFTSCNKDDTPSEFKDLGGTWVTDASGKTFSIWNYGKAWNAWTFNADGTGVCDVFFLAEEEPVAIQHQPFTYTAGDGKLVTLMEDGPWDWTYKTEGGRLTLSYEGSSGMTFDKADAAQTAQFEEWSKRELLSVPGLQARYTIFVYGNAGGKMDTDDHPERPHQVDGRHRIGSHEMGHDDTIEDQAQLFDDHRQDGRCQIRSERSADDIILALGHGSGFLCFRYKFSYFE